MSDAPEATLARYRAQIDTLDEEIAARLIARTAIVRQVGTLKDGLARDDHHLRPGREASMVRRIVERFRGQDFQPMAAAAIWRIVIGASTSVETAVTVSASDDPCRWLAREYWGPFTPVTVSADPLSDVLERRTELAVLPMPREGDTDGWWRPLADDPAYASLKIFACLPFVLSKGESPQALAVGRVVPERTGDDVHVCLKNNAFAQSSARHTTDTSLGVYASPLFLSSNTSR